METSRWVITIIGLRTKSKMTLEFFARQRSLSLLEAQLVLPYGRL